jgi:hypothetical protein
MPYEEKAKCGVSVGGLGARMLSPLMNSCLTVMSSGARVSMMGNDGRRWL